jgi:hydrogenase maturation protease
MASHRMVIGIGNRDRGDDGAGCAVAEVLRGGLPASIEVAEHDGEAASLLARLEGAAAAFLVDACVSDAPPGTVRRFDVAAAPLPHNAFGLSSHGLGLATAVELARALGQLPRRCVVYAIEGQSFAAGAPLSPPVGEAVAAVARLLRAEIAGDMAAGERSDA